MRIIQTVKCCSLSVIRVLSERVEREHGQHLRDAQRVEDRSALAVNGASASGTMLSSGMDFESLVGGGRVKVASPPSQAAESTGWEDDVWGSMLGSNVSVFLPSADDHKPTEYNWRICV